MTNSVSIIPVSDKKTKRDFLDVPFIVYADDKNWVPPLYFERFEHLDPRKNPYFQHAEVQLFVAYQNGKPVGRISAQDDRLRLETHRDNAGMFGFVDSIDDANVYTSLTTAAADWLRARGRTKMVGPFSFSINDESGLLVDGFDTPPNMMMGHNKPYADAHMRTLGFRKIKDMLAYFAHRDLQSAAIKRVHDRALASGEFSVRPLNLSNVQAEVRLIMNIFNDAWSNNWGFVPFTEPELDKLGKDLKMLVSSNYGMIASYRGEPAGFAVTLPNLNDWTKHMNGRLLPFNWLKLASQILRKKPASTRMPLMGVRSAFHGTTIGSTLAALCIMPILEFHKSRGVQSMELSWILEDNMPIRKIIESFGAKPYKTYRIYEKVL
jgi:hypothetical protein